MCVWPKFWRVAICVVVVACSQPLLETYGCACASRSYTQEELAEYRSLAERNDPRGLEEMEEYHSWRSGEYPTDSDEYRRETRIIRGYFKRRLATGDRDAVDEEIWNFYFRGMDEDLSLQARVEAIRAAKALVEQYPEYNQTLIDISDEGRPELPAQIVLDGALRLLETS